MKSYHMSEINYRTLEMKIYIHVCLFICFLPEPRISCMSHISTKECSLTCELLEGSNHNEDDEDGEGDCIESMSLW